MSKTVGRNGAESGQMFCRHLLLGRTISQTPTGFLLSTKETNLEHSRATLSHLHGVQTLSPVRPLGTLPKPRVNFPITPDTVLWPLPRMRCTIDCRLGSSKQASPTIAHSIKPFHFEATLFGPVSPLRLHFARTFRPNGEMEI